MSVWYCHTLTTVYIVRGQDPHLFKPRAERGWPTYEELMAAVFKQPPPTRGIHLEGLGQRDYTYPWSKVVEVGGAEAGGVRQQQPPLAPSRFDAVLAGLHFTSGADRDIVGTLYRQTMTAGFGGLTALRYVHLGWGDAEVEQLSATLREVPCADVIELDLSSNKLRSGEALAGVGELRALRVLKLSCCHSLSSLPSTLGQCEALSTLDLDGCYSLLEMPDLSHLPSLEVELLPDHLKLWEAEGGRKALNLVTGEGCPRDATTHCFKYCPIDALPEWVAECKQLRSLGVYDCKSLTSLPSTFGQCEALSTLNLSECSSLTSLPSTLGQCKALSNLDLLGCSSLTSLPSTLGQCKALSTLNLRECSSLTSLPSTLGQCEALSTLNLGGCKSVLEMPDLSLLPSLEKVNLPHQLKPWEAGGRKAYRVPQ